MYQPRWETDDLHPTSDRLFVVETTGDEPVNEVRPISNFLLVIAFVFGVATMAIAIYAVVSPLANL